VMVVPGVLIDQTSNGFVGMEVSVVVYSRLSIDMLEVDTLRLADATEGIFVTTDAVDAKLVNSFLAGIIAVPITPQRQTAASRGPGENSEWVSVERVYHMKFNVAYPAPQSTS